MAPSATALAICGTPPTQSPACEQTRYIGLIAAVDLDVAVVHDDAHATGEIRRGSDALCQEQTLCRIQLLFRLDAGQHAEIIRAQLGNRLGHNRNYRPECCGW